MEEDILNKRFFRLCMLYWPAAFSLMARGKYMLEHPRKYNFDKKYDLCRTISKTLGFGMRAVPHIYGQENLSRETGIFYVNHQGQYDMPSMLPYTLQSCSVMWDKRSEKKKFSWIVTDLLEATSIDLENPKEAIKSIREVIERVKAGRSYVIFPEGGYTDNHNSLQDFKSGCFTCSLKTKTPIYPVAIYDSYAVMEQPGLGKVHNEVHFLKPIPYEEYKDMHKNEIADLVKQRIQEKLDEITLRRQTATI